MAFTFATQLKDIFAAVMAYKDLSEAVRCHFAIARRKANVQITDGGTAATAVTETPFHSVGTVCGAIVKGVSIAFPVAITASGSVFATFTVSKRTAGGSKATVATISTNTTDPTLGANAAAFVEYQMALTLANLVLAAGDTLQVEVAKASTGTAFASATASARVTVDLEETAT